MLHSTITPRAATMLVKRTLVGMDGVREVHTTTQTDATSTIMHLTDDADGVALMAFLTGAFADAQVSDYTAYQFIGVSFPHEERS